MSLTLAIALNVILDLAILGALAFAMSRARHLRPHRLHLAGDGAAQPPRATPRRKRRRDLALPRELATARS